jgi:S-formylglutathione hydrolase FrmB
MTTVLLTLLLAAGPFDGLAGTLLDFTANHGADRRIWSPALGERRAVYVYLPPGFDGRTPLPAGLWLHGLGQSEKGFADVAPLFDAAIRCGKLPPIILAAPDGSIQGRPTLVRTGSFYVNSAAGRFADYIVDDVWHGLVRANFPVKPDRRSHVLAGASMGGFGAYHLGLTRKAEFGVLVGVFPPLDLTYADCRGRFLGEFDAFCRGVRTEFPRNEVVGRFGPFAVRSSRLTDPLVGGRRADLDERSAFIRAVNPADLLDVSDIRPGEFDLWVGYGTRDEFNASGTVQSFAERCRARGFQPDVVVLPDGRHNRATAQALFPAAADWLRPRLAADTTTAP